MSKATKRIKQLYGRLKETERELSKETRSANKWFKQYRVTDRALREMKDYRNNWRTNYEDMRKSYEVACKEISELEKQLRMCQKELSDTECELLGWTEEADWNIHCEQVVYKLERIMGRKLWGKLCDFLDLMKTI